MKNKLGIALMTIGAAIVILALTLLFYNIYEDKKAAEAAESVLPSLSEAIENAEGVPDPYDTGMKTVLIDGNEYIGRLSIPSIGLDLPVISQWDYEKFKIAPCRYYGSSKTDDLVIAAHNYPAYFRKVLSLKPGDEVFFTDIEGTVSSFVVSNVEILPPAAVEDMIGGDWDLTLFTCTRGARSRMAVRCIKAEDS